MNTETPVLRAITKGNAVGTYNLFHSNMAHDRREVAYADMSDTERLFLRAALERAVKNNEAHSRAMVGMSHHW